MLQGLVRCSACGATLCRSSAQNSVQCYAYAHGKCTTSHSISIKKLNASVFSALEKCSLTGEFNLKIKQKAVLPEENIPALISKEKRKLDRIKEAYEAEIYTLQEYNASRQKILSSVASLEKKLLSSVPDEESARRRIRDQITSLLPTLKSPAVNESYKNSLLKQIVDRIVFYRSNCTIEVYFYA